MCGRYTISTKIALLAEYFDAQVPAEEVKPNYNAAPSMELPVILNTSPEEISLVKWGFIPSWDKAGKMKPQINARLETASEKPMFRVAYKRRHCLVLADGFYEWHTEDGKKVPYRITRADKKPFAMAGLWETKPGSEDNQPSTFTILTTEANEMMRPIHHIMPVIIEHGKERDWLDIEDGLEEDQPTLSTIGSDEMTSYKVSTAVNSPRNNCPEVMEKIKD